MKIEKGFGVMKISKERLRRIILEEIKAVREANPGHDGRGRFARKGSGKTYSLTDNALDDVASDSELEVPARGRITSKGKISSKYGMNTGDPDKNCGRLTIDGKAKKKTRSCKDYPKSYWEKNEAQEQDVLSTADDAYLKALVLKQVKSALGQVQKSGGAGGRGCSWTEIMQALNDIETASKPRKTETEKS
tara:strand:- start:44 stop:616 length:573 start_codon:yes stop_codon:yes gene_type:complete